MFQAVNYQPTDADGWGGQLGAILEYFDSLEDDYHYTHTADWAHELYESEVQPHQSINSPHNRCNLTVSRWPISRTPLSLRQFSPPKKLTYYTTHFPDKLLLSTVTPDSAAGAPAEIDVWNVGIINGSNWHEEKVKMLETVYNRIHVQVTESDRDVLLGGDFNAPKREDEDGTITPHGGGTPMYRRHPENGSPFYFGESADEVNEYTFSDRWQRAERQIFDPDVGGWGLRDAYWAATESSKQSSSEDWTHEIASGGRKRLDHILASERFAVNRCEILNDEIQRESGPDVSDHAPVVAELPSRA